MSLIRLSTLGAIRIEGTTPPDLPPRSKLLALVAYIARRTGTVRREELAALLWGDKPEALARQSLRHALMRLRRSIDDATLVVSGDDVRLTPGSVELDVACFETALSEGRLADAVRLWHGDFLDGFEDAGCEAWRLWLEAERESLRRRLAYAFATLVEDAEARGDWEGATQWAEQWFTALPLDERAQLRWIQMLRLAGKPMDALAVHARLIHYLRNDLGVEPDPAVTRLGDELARTTQSAPHYITGSAALRTPHLVGRTTAFAALVAAWRAAQANEGAVVVIEGSDGIGKTRLLEEFLRWHAEQNAHALVLSGRAFDSERDHGWSTARDLFEGLRSAPGLSGAPDPALAELAELIPGIAQRFRNLPPPTRTVDALARALSQVLNDVAAEVPVLIVLDDFTSADADSARLMLSLARRPTAGVAIVLAERTNGLEQNDRARELRAAASLRRVRLQALDLHDVEALIASMLQMEASARRALAAHVFARTAGNPLQTVELVASLADQGRLFIGPDGTWQVDQAYAQMPEPTTQSRRWRIRRRTTFAAVIAVVASAAVFASARPPSSKLPTLAVGEIVDQTGSDSAMARMPLSDLLATRLATLPRLSVISPERMHELRAQLAARMAVVPGLDAARHAGAEEVVQGTILRARSGALRLELRRVNLENGSVAAAYSVEGSDALALIDAATREIAHDFSIPVHAGPAGMPASLVAYRMYEEGLRAFYQGDAAAAHRFFAAALVEDSTFAMAAFYDWTSKFWAGLAEPEADFELARVVRLAERAPERESLLIRAMWASHVHAPERLALADTLAIRYPHEPDGHQLLGQAKYAAGDFLGAVPHFRRVVNMDTLSARNATLRCRACDALAQIIAAYSLADSMPAAERAAREWTKLQPATARPWVYLATTLEYQNRFQDALGARRKAAAYQPGNRVDPVYPARVEIRQGNYVRGDPMLRQLMSDGPAAVSREAAWHLIISLRQQGRLREALEVAREYGDTLSEAVVQLEMGNAQKSAAWFEAYAAGRRSEDPLVRFVNHRIWQRAHAATARAAAGDTSALRRLADELAELSAQTSAGRNRKLHHYVLGLLHAARGDHKQAVTAYESSVHSLTNAYGRINLELARSLLATNQPQRAVHVLEAALRGPLDAGNYYVPHTDFRELLGVAYEAAALPDSAIVQYRRVLTAWSAADPSFHARRALVRARLDAILR